MGVSVSRDPSLNVYFEVLEMKETDISLEGALVATYMRNLGEDMQDVKLRRC